MILSQMQLIPAMISFCMLLLAVVFRFRFLSWSHPAVVFSLFWFGMTILPIVFVTELVVSSRAVAYILLACLFFGAPALFFNWKSTFAIAASRPASRVNIMSGAPFFAALLAYIALMVVFNIFHLRANGFEFFAILSDPFAVGCEFLGIRYSGRVIPNIFISLANILGYVAAPLAGLAVARQKSFFTSALILFLATIPAILNIVLYGDKGTIFLAIALFYGGVVAGRIRHGNTALITWRGVLALPILLIYIGTFTALALINRQSTTCIDRTAAVFSQLKDNVGAQTGSSLRSYAFGHLFAFSDWFDHYLSGQNVSEYIIVLPKGKLKLPENPTPEDRTYDMPNSPSWGFWTFMAVGKLAAPEKFESLPPGYFAEYFRKPGYLQSNIYTFFRGLINDFSLYGSLVFLSVAGALMSVVYRSLLLQQFSGISSAMYIAFAGFLYTSYIISLFIWTGIYVSMAIVAIVIWALYYWEGRMQQR